MSALGGSPGWSINLQATQTVRKHALDDADRLRLLDMLGLVQPGTLLLVPDDSRSYDDVNASMMYHPDNDANATAELPTHGTPKGAAVLHGDGVLCVRCQQAVDRAAHLAAQTQPQPQPRRPRSPRAAAPTPPPAVSEAPEPRGPPTPASPADPPAASAIDHALADELDDWFAGAQRSPHPRVRRAATTAITQLHQLRLAMDTLARAERATRPGEKR